MTKNCHVILLEDMT
jgi:signal transduction histidine kinase